jgi:RNA polymerase sigma factor (sigma-70 family)
MGYEGNPVAPSTDPPLSAPTEPLRMQTLEQYRPALHLYLLRKLRQPKRDLADLTQEVFARFLRIQERGQGIRHPLAYMYKIASQLVSTVIDQTSIVTYDSQLAEDALEQATFEQADEFSRRMDLRQDILAALEQLPAAHRAILLLVEVEGMSCKEAARETGYAVQTCRQYLSMARRMLLTILEGNGSEKDRYP